MLELMLCSPGAHAVGPAARDRIEAARLVLSLGSGPTRGLSSVTSGGSRGGAAEFGLGGRLPQSL
jgi:hypothetical protein